MDHGALAELYDRYATAASTSDGAERTRLLRECTTDDVEIVSPFPYRLRGIEAIAEQLGKVAASMPGGRMVLRRTSDVDAHHDVFRVTFENCNAEGVRMSTGMHVIEVREHRIARIIVFVPDNLGPTVTA